MIFNVIVVDFSDRFVRWKELFRDCDMKDEYGQFGSKKIASCNWTFSSSHHEDFKKRKRGEKRKLKQAHDDQDYEKRSKHPLTSLGILYFKILKAPSNIERYSWYGIKLIWASKLLVINFSSKQHIV